MTRVWKCDYCSENSIWKKEIKNHETVCSFNPINRTCNSCSLQELMGMPISGVYYGCGIGVTGWEDIKEDDLPCDHHKIKEGK